jgi:hypothetical protein
MLGFTPFEIGSGVLAFLVGALMFASQVGPDEAISNLSLWVQKAGVHAPAWLRARATDKWVFRIGFLVLLVLSFSFGVRVTPWLYPPPPPQIVQVPAPSLPQHASELLSANTLPPIPTEIGSLAARYLLLKKLISSTKEWRGIAASSGPMVRDSIKALTTATTDRIYQERVGDVTAQWNACLKEFQRINDDAYSNRQIDLKSVPELSIPTLTAPDEAAFTKNDEATQRARYDYRAFHFLTINVLRQADSLISDMQREQNSIAEALQKTARGKDFLTVSP